MSAVSHTCFWSCCGRVQSVDQISYEYQLETTANHRICATTQHPLTRTLTDSVCGSLTFSCVDEIGPHDTKYQVSTQRSTIRTRTKGSNVGGISTALSEHGLTACCCLALCVELSRSSCSFFSQSVGLRVCARTHGLTGSRVSRRAAGCSPVDYRYSGLREWTLRQSVSRSGSDTFSVFQRLSLFEFGARKRGMQDSACGREKKCHTTNGFQRSGMNHCRDGNPVSAAQRGRRR